jgi:hypothetical protein
MKFPSTTFSAVGAVWLAIGLMTLLPEGVSAQWPIAQGTSAGAQRNALAELQSQARWLENATRTAPNLGAQGCDNLRQQFQAFRNAYNSLKQSLTPRQLADGANALAELDAGLDILEEGFANYQEDVAAGRPVGPALQNLCQALREGSRLWLQECNKICAQLRVGRG